MKPAVPPAPPLVSAVITTRARPALVGRAVQSVLTQQGPPLELIVVMDGPDPETHQTLQSWRDPRLRVLPLPQRLGANAARNAGIAASRGQWVGLLDDDDEWLPGKLSAQLAAARQSRFSRPVVACQVRVNNGRAEWVRPRRCPGPFEPVGDYLFCRHHFICEGFVQTSMLLAPRDLFHQVPFDDRVRKFQDADWLLRACSQSKVGLEMVMSPLGVWHVEADRRRQSHEPVAVGELLAWLRSRRALVSRRAYAAFLLNMAGPQIPPTAWRERWHLLREAFRAGSPNVQDCVLFGISAVIPPHWRARLRARLLSWLAGNPKVGNLRHAAPVPNCGHLCSSEIQDNNGSVGAGGPQCEGRPLASGVTMPL